MLALFDFPAARLKQARAKALKGDRFLGGAATEGVADRLGAVTRKFDQGLFLGETVPPALVHFAAHWTVAAFDAHDLLEMGEARFDLAVSLYSLQAVNDLPGALIQIRRALKPDGLMLATLFGGGTLNELRQAFAQAESETLGGISPRVSPFADVRDGGALLQRAGFALPVADVEKLVARYRDFSGLVRDLRIHGQTNVLTERSRKTLRRDTLAALLQHYGAVDGRLPATFETLYLTGWAPHQDQQQPLKPGSAKARLADALGVKEISVEETGVRENAISDPTKPG